MKKALLLMAFAMAFTATASAQRWSVSTNLVDYASLGTLNIEGSAGVGRRITVNTSARVNPWTYHKGDPGRQMQNRHQTYAVGVRYWPWHIHSGWWIGGMAQYQEYNRGGIVSRKTEEGDAFGLSASGGYSLMIHDRINLDFGLSVWGGQKTFIEYACPSCGRITGKGSRWFVAPNEVRVSIAYVF